MPIPNHLAKGQTENSLVNTRVSQKPATNNVRPGTCPQARRRLKQFNAIKKNTFLQRPWDRRRGYWTCALKFRNAVFGENSACGRTTASCTSLVVHNVARTPQQHAAAACSTLFHLLSGLRPGCMYDRQGKDCEAEQFPARSATESKHGSSGEALAF